MRTIRLGLADYIGRFVTKVFRTEYTSIGRPTNIQSAKRRKDDGTFQTTTRAYDARNRLLTTTLPDGVQLTNEYTGDHLTRTYYRVGGVEIPHLQQHYEYDARGYRTHKRDARNNLTQYGYDDKGRLTSIANPLGQQTLYTYVQDRLTQVETGRTSTNGEGQVTRYVHDARDRAGASR